MNKPLLKNLTLFNHMNSMPHKLLLVQASACTRSTSGRSRYGNPNEADKKDVIT
jgi:hypothetical protein